MRGVISGGMVSALEALQLRDTFDAVYGTSAGALAGAYFIAGQAHLGTSIYYQDLIDERFISFRRLVSKKPIVSMRYLFDSIIKEKKKLKFELFREASVDLHVGLTDAQSGQPKAVNSFNNIDELTCCLEASSTMPILAGEPVAYNGRHFYDGGIHHQIPYRMAVDDNCSHILVLIPRSKTWPIRTRSWSEELASVFLARRYGKGLGQAQKARRRTIAKDLSLLFLELNRVRSAPPNILPVLTDDGTPRIGRTEQRPERLMAGALSGYQAVFDTLQYDNRKTLLAPINLSLDGELQKD